MPIRTGALISSMDERLRGARARTAYGAAEDQWSRVAFRRFALFVQYLRASSVYRREGPLPKIGLRPANRAVKAMRMNFGEVFEIRDLGKHSAVAVISLGIVLAGDVNVTPDSERKDFYEVQGGSTIYYIYVSPVTGSIDLIATWKNSAQPLPQVDVATVGSS